MNNPAYARKTAVQFQMRGQIRGRPQRAFNNPALHIHDHHVFRFHAAVVNPAGFYNDQSLLPQDRRGVAPGEGYQTVAWKAQVGLQTAAFNASNIGQPFFERLTHFLLIFPNPAGYQ